MNRRDFIRLGAAAGTGAGVILAGRAVYARVPEGLGPAPEQPFAAPPIENVRIGFVGVGNMGTSHLRNLVRIDGCQITAVCDIVESKVAAAQQIIEDAGFPKPTGYANGETDFKRMCAEEDLDLVFTATPWRWHVPVCVSAMENGKHAATEVPAAVTIEECWQLVETAERQQKHCIMMENCCYGRAELQILLMVRRGVFGDLLHGEGGYLHDLREFKFSFGEEGRWRREGSMHRHGNLYPTHGLGPIAQCMNINRGDRFDYMVSVSSPALGLARFAEDHFDADDPRRAEMFINGDYNTSLIKTVNGRSVVVQYTCDAPRPYSRINMLQGTKAITQGFPDRVYIEGRSPAHTWEPLEQYQREFEHPLWAQIGGDASGAGHGGMDYIEDYRLIKCLREGLPLDMDVYDAAAWSAVGPLSEQSVANRAETVDFPDFTRGRWETWEPLGIVEA
jgi:predicted dehydrogenase